jgi:mannitol/fructose-specific phosphotransferase system IIA component (Ntr-type)
MATMREINLPKFYMCSSWDEFFREMENCLQNGITINHQNYQEHLPLFEKQYSSWVDSHNE